MPRHHVGDKQPMADQFGLPTIRRVISKFRITIVSNASKQFDWDGKTLRIKSCKIIKEKFSIFLEIYLILITRTITVIRSHSIHTLS
jgi:hypothetical protein